MLNASLAQNFVDRVHRQLQLNVNIMNDKGIIIASTDSARIGDFHIIAHDIISRRQLVHQIDRVNDELIGVKRPGVNLLMLDENDPIGVVGVSGDPEEVLPVARAIKFALEAMISYQESSTNILLSKSKSSKLTYSLLLETPQNPARVSKLAAQLGYKNECLRFPILITLSGFNSPLCMEALVDLFGGRFKSGSQDIILPVDGQNALLLLSLPSVYVVDYELFAMEVAKETKAHLQTRVASGDFKVRFICGIPQTTLFACRGVFQAMSWLKNKKYNHEFDVIYLKHYYIEYTTSQLDHNSLRIFFAFYYNLLCEKNELEMFMETVGALVDSNMKPDIAAAKLYMHKNTVTARMKKIKDILNISPMTDTKDAAFLTALYEYAQKSK